MLLALGHVQIGVIGGAGATARLPRLIGMAKEKEPIFVGDWETGKEAYRIGLVNQVYPQKKYMEGAIELARRIASVPPRALKAAKKSINEGLSMGLRESLEFAGAFADSLVGEVELEHREKRPSDEC